MVPKISFVMATKNRQDLISESIDSVLAQTISDWELVIVDDHSSPSDETEQIVRNYKDNRIRFERLPDKNGNGISCGRNYGNFLASAKIIAVQDSDDLSMPDRAKLVLDSYEKEKWDVFYGNFLLLNNETHELTEPGKKPMPFSMEKYFNREFFIPDCSSAYTKKMALQYPYNSAYSIALDLDFFSRMAVDKKKFYFCPEIIYKYRIHDDSMTKGKGFREIDQQILKSRGWNNE